MKITAATGENFVLDEFQILQITLNKLREVYNWQSNYFIDQGKNKVMKTETYHTTHSWDEYIEVRDATPSDYEFSKILTRLTSLK